MTTQEINSIVAEVMSHAFGMPVAPDDAFARSGCAAWDSLKHIELIVTLEERFDISFDAAQLPELTSKALFVECIGKLLRHA